MLVYKIFLNVKEQGRWWIVGSAWQKQSSRDKTINNTQKIEQQFNQKKKLIN